MADIWGANFETNTTGEFSSLTGTPTVVTTPVYRGSYGGQITWTAALQRFIRDTFTPIVNGYCRVALRINVTAYPTVPIAAMQLIRFETAGLATTLANVAVDIPATSGDLVLKMFRSGAGTPVQSASFTLTNNTWCLVEMFGFVNTATPTAGSLQWKVNGTIIGTATGSQNMGSVAIGAMTFAAPALASGLAGTVHFDTILLSDTAYPGGLAIGDIFAPGIAGHGTASFTATSGTSLTPTLPRTVLASDVTNGLVHVMLCHHSANGPFVTPSGWDILGDGNGPNLDDNNTTAQRVTVFVRRAQLGDGTPTVSLVTPTVTSVRGAVIIGVSGVAGSTNLDGIDQADRTLDTASTATINFPSITTTQAHDLALALYAKADNPATVTTPTGWFQVGDAAFDSALGTLGMTIGYCWRPLATGTLGAFAMTHAAVTSTVGVGAMVAFKGMAVPGADILVPRLVMPLRQYAVTRAFVY